MTEHAEQDQINSNYADWWDETVHFTKKDKWKPAVQDYFDYHDIPYSHEKFSNEFVKRIIPHVAHYDDRWKRFRRDNFNPVAHKAHKALFNMVDEEFTRLVEEAENEKKQAIEKKKQDQLEKQSEDEAVATALENSIAINRPRRNNQRSAGDSVDARSNNSSAKKNKKKSKSLEPKPG